MDKHESVNIFDAINAGKYKNALPYARKKDDPEAWERYAAENARLHALFTHDLLAHLGLEPGPAAEALFRFAWEKGHSSGFSEVVIEASDAVDLLAAGAAAERAKIRREHQKLVELLYAGSWDGSVIHWLKSHFDRIAPEEG